MFYEPHKRNHGLPHDPFKAIVAPRPIGWITTMNLKGEINLAPYSFFNGLSAEPPLVMFCSEGRKDSVAYPRGVDEMKEAGLEPAPSILVRPPRVKASPCAMECKWLQTTRVNDVDGNLTQRYVVFGQV